MASNFQLGRHGFMKQIRFLTKRALATLVVACTVGAHTAWAQQIQEDSISAVTGAGAGLSSMAATKGLDLPRVGTPSIRQFDSVRAAQAMPERAPVPPAPLVPNDFQKFVQDATGQSLPLFGSEFFKQSGAFASSQSTPVSADYRIGPGDEVLIRGWGSVDIDVRTAVDRNGLIFIPRVGSVSVAGLQSSQLESAIRAAIARYYRDFQLSVTQGQIRGITVYMVGQARQPGAYTLLGSSTLVSALFASGGPNQLGSLRHIQVKRGSQVVTELDLYDFIAKGNKQADVRLQDGDTIYIPPAKGFVALVGKVATPAVYELATEQETIGQVLSLAGGLPVVADPKQAYLERVEPSRKPARSVESFALDNAGLNKTLRSGDLLTVQALSVEFGNAVTLRGNVAQPARVPWREGLRVRDLIPTKSVLMSKESVARQNGVLLQNNETESTLAGRIGNLVDEVNLEYAVVERVNAADVTVKLLPFNLGAVLADASSVDNLILQPGDVITVFSVNDVRVPQVKRQIYVRVEGEVKRPGVYQMSPGDGLGKLVEKAGGLTPEAYLFGSAFYREEVRRAQAANLEQLTRRLEAQLQTKLSASAANSSTSADAAASTQVRVQAEMVAQKQAVERLKTLKPTGRIMLGLSGNSVSVEQLPNVALEGQDRLVIPPRPDFVSVLGSVNSESSMLFDPGSSVGDYLDRAGLTSGADQDEIFVLRADGSVISDSGSWFSKVKRAKVLPGDVIVLPEKIDHESAWSVFTRNAKDVTQIIYQFSLGAAAIKTLRQ
jgi:protein involved in polysaccharide export with SLBB domain